MTLDVLQADAFVTPVSSTCARCGGLAAKHGAWLLDQPLEAVCAACFLWVDGHYVEEQIARGLAASPPLKPHQPACARFLARRRYALLGSDMGLGKGRSSLTAVPPGVPVVVLSPKSMAHEWYDEAAKWRPDLHPYRGAAKNFAWPGPSMLVSVNYEAAPLSLPAPGTVFILDEPHLKVKNPGAELTQRIRGLCRWAVVHGGRCWLLTGTPLINTPKDMLDLLDLVLIGHAAYGSKAYYREVCGAAYSKKRGQKEAGKIENLPELRRRLGKVVIRHLKKDLPQEEKLPPKRVQVIPVEISPEDARVIHEHVRRLVAARRTNEEVLSGRIPSPRERGLTAEQKEYRKSVWQAHFNLILANLTDPDEQEIVAAIETALEHQGELPGFEELAEVRSALATAKIRAAGEWAGKFEAQGEPCVFFCCHRMPIDALGKREGWAVVTGSETAKKRKEAKDAFQRGELRGLGVMVRAGGTGLTLTRSNNEVFIDRDWTSAANEQAEGRLDRISQTREVTVWRLVANHAVDRHVERICERKAQLIEAILGQSLVDGDEEWAGERERVLAWRRA